MTQIAVINGSSKLRNVDVAFLVEACAIQLFEFCERWNLQPWAIGAYNSAAGLPADDIFIFEYVDTLDVDGALAYHSVDALGRPYGRMLPPSDPLDATDLSHEVLETRGDEDCDRWMKMPGGSEVAVEVCDPVQGDSYSVAATVLGETRQVRVSNYVLPPWFEGSNVRPGIGFDRLNNLTAPFTLAPGGYMAVLDSSGNESDVFARLRHGSLASAALASRLAVGNSRLLRRLRGRRAA